MVEREVAPVVGAFFEGCDERTEERPGGRRFSPRLHLDAFGCAGVCVLAPAAANKLASAVQQLD